MILKIIFFDVVDKFLPYYFQVLNKLFGSLKTALILLKKTDKKTFPSKY